MSIVLLSLITSLSDSIISGGWFVKKQNANGQEKKCNCPDGLLLVQVTVTPVGDSAPKPSTASTKTYRRGWEKIFRSAKPSKN